MDEINNMEEESLSMVDEKEPMTNDELTKAIEEQMNKLRRQSMLLGAQAMCSTILQKILDLKTKSGKKTYRDLERLVADIQKFCETGLSRRVGLDGETEEIKEDESRDSEVSE